MMANLTVTTPVGIVTKVTGKVIATGPEGKTSELKDGSPVFIQTVVKTTDDARVIIDLVNGNHIDLDEKKMVKICDYYQDQDSKDPASNNEATAVADNQARTEQTGQEDQPERPLTEAEKIQQRILAGDDPTEGLEAPGAGIVVGPTGDSLGSAVKVGRVGGVGNVFSGHDTTGLTLESGAIIQEPVLLAEDNTINVKLSVDDSGQESDTLTHKIELLDSAGNLLDPAEITQDVTVTLRFKTPYAGNSLDGFVPGSDVDRASTFTVTIPAGSNSADVNVAALSDTLAESQERYELLISDVDITTTKTVTTSGTAAGTIIAPTIDINDITVSESDDYAVFTVTIRNSHSTLDLELFDGSAEAAKDFHAANGIFQYRFFSNGAWGAWTDVDPLNPIQIPAGDSDLEVRTDVINDTIDEVDETFQLTGNLTTGGAIYSATGTATIIDNDIPTLNVGASGTGTGDITVAEGIDAVFGVEIKDAAAGSTLQLVLEDGTALDADYFDSINGYFEYQLNGGSWTAVPGNGIITNIPEGDSSLLVRTDTIADGIQEADETFILKGILTSNGIDYQDDATATINDTPVFSISDYSLVEGDQTDPYAQFTISLSQTSTTDTTFELTLADVEAIIGTDTEAPDQMLFSTDGGNTWQSTWDAGTSKNTVTIAAGENGVIVGVPITDDQLLENDETFTLTATRVAGSTSNTTIHRNSRGNTSASSNSRRSHGRVSSPGCTASQRVKRGNSITEQRGGRADKRSLAAIIHSKIGSSSNIISDQPVSQKLNIVDRAGGNSLNSQELLQSLDTDQNISSHTLGTLRSVQGTTNSIITDAELALNLAKAAVDILSKAAEILSGSNRLRRGNTSLVHGQLASLVGYTSKGLLLLVTKTALPLGTARSASAALAVLVGLSSIVASFRHFLS